MTFRISSEVKEARAKLRTITRETERALDRLQRDGQPINLSGLTALVALGTGMTLDDVSVSVRAYVSARKDINLIKR